MKQPQRRTKPKPAKNGYQDQVLLLILLISGGVAFAVMGVTTLILRLFD